MKGFFNYRKTNWYKKLKTQNIQACVFSITNEEYDSSRSQIASLKNMKIGGHSKYLPFVFTEKGMGGLAKVLKSESAINVNEQIVRAFMALRQYS